MATRRKQALSEALERGRLVLDAGMGTALLSRGVPTTACLEQLCESHPAWVTDIHRAHLRAGAQAVLSHSFGANRIRLAVHGCADGAPALNRLAATLARSAAETYGDSDTLVLGSMGPSGLLPKDLESQAQGHVQAAFATQARALVEAGVDGLLLETFRDPAELRLALSACAGLPVPCWASVAPDGSGCCAGGAPVRQVLEAAIGWGADAVGLNCGDDSERFTATFARLDGLDAPRFCRPSAGLPTRIGDELHYPVTPAGFFSLARRLFQLGSRAVGGCCGTTAEHVAQVARAAASPIGSTPVMERG